MKNTKRKLIFNLTLCAAALVLVIFSAQIFPSGNELNMAEGLQSPCMNHLFGTDNLGRDLFARSFNGLKVSLALALAVQILSLLIGTVFGVMSGYHGGIVDRVFVLIQNVLMSFPSTLASLCMVLLLGTGVHTLIIALVVVDWVSYARLIRSEVITIKEAEFIQGVRAIGSSNTYLMVHHIVPNIIRPMIPVFTLMIGHTVLAISGLGFLGFGVQPPNAEIGLMIKDGLTYINKAPWMFLLPGVMLVLYSFMFNVISDQLQDWFNPHKEMGPE